MNQAWITQLIGITVIVALSAPGVCAAKGPTDLLADQADAVVVAEVKSGQQTGRLLVFVLSISRTLKGDLTVGSLINVSGAEGTSAGIPANRSLGGQYGLWFLKRTGSQWTFLPVIQGGATLESAGYVPLLKTTSPAAVTTGLAPATMNDQVAVELVAALQSYTDPKQLYPVALHLSRISESATLPGLYRNLRASPDLQLKFIGLAGLLGGADEVSALADIARNVDMIPSVRTASLVEVAISGIRNPDPGVIPSLGTIASSSDISAQRCAAMALENIHSRDALPFLAQLLYSPDPMSREAAMSGLSRFVDNLPIQTAYNILNGRGLLPQGPTPYRTPETDRYSLSRRQLGSGNEAEYLQFWKSWWTTMKEEVMASGH